MSKNIEELKQKAEQIPIEEWPNYFSKLGYEVPLKFLEKLKERSIKDITIKQFTKLLRKGGYKPPSKKIEKLKEKAGDRFPNHVGLIIDGNRRWARKRHLDSNAGHFAGYMNLRKMIFSHADLGIKYLSIYTLSIENIQKRDPEEIRYLYDLIIKIVDDILSEREDYREKVKVNVFGKLSILPENVKVKLEEIMEKTQNNEEYFLNLCIAYDGQEEITDAVKEILKNGLKPEDITREVIKNYLYTKKVPELDYIVRTGMKDGARISGFLLWDASYAEFKFRDEFWPDYNEKMLINDLEEYLKRNRRKGK